MVLEPSTYFLSPCRTPLESQRLLHFRFISQIPPSPEDYNISQVCTYMEGSQLPQVKKAWKRGSLPHAMILPTLQDLDSKFLFVSGNVKLFKILSCDGVWSYDACYSFAFCNLHLNFKSNSYNVFLLPSQHRQPKNKNAPRDG